MHVIIDTYNLLVYINDFSYFGAGDSDTHICDYISRGG